MSESAAAPSLPAPPLDRATAKRLVAELEHLRRATYDPDDLSQFMAFAGSMAPKSKAQLFQDLWALWICGRKHGGYFVEFGAANGVELSNTYLLEKEMGWSGILAEPNPHFAKSLERNRRCIVSDRCVYSASGETLEFLAAQKGEFSRIASIAPGDSHEERRRSDAETITVQTISLNDLLTEHGAPAEIDYLSLDTEGSEFEILKAFDFERWRVKAITVEHNYMPIRQHLHDLLSGKGFRRTWPELSRWDDWYVRD